MTITMLHSKIHRATVTDANLNYVGSITIDRDLLDAANMRIGQKIDIVNVNNGERFSTYIIAGERGKREICLNGAAARLGIPGDLVIIMTFHYVDDGESAPEPTVIHVDDGNRPGAG